MNKKQKSRLIIGVVVALGLLGSALIASTMSPNVLAATCGKDSDGKAINTTIISCGDSQNAVWSLLEMALNILSAGIGIAAVGGLALAAMKYTTAEDNASKVSEAKQMIFNIIVGLVGFALMYSLLQFLIPGGIFK